MSNPIDILLDQVDWQPVTFSDEPSDDLPHATHFGILRIADYELRVFQLSDGQRIILKEDMERFFGFGLEPSNLTV